jgi:hypothetical protein
MLQLACLDASLAMKVIFFFFFFFFFENNQGSVCFVRHFGGGLSNAVAVANVSKGKAKQKVTTFFVIFVL